MLDIGALISTLEFKINLNLTVSDIFHDILLQSIKCLSIPGGVACFRIKLNFHFYISTLLKNAQNDLLRKR